MGTLAESIAANTTTRKGPRCSIDVTLEVLDAGDRADLVGALESATVPASAISAALRKAGHNVGQNAVQRHRRGDCVCAR